MWPRAPWPLLGFWGGPGAHTPRSTASPRGPEKCSGDGQRLDAPSCWPGRRDLGHECTSEAFTDSREAGTAARHPQGSPSHWHRGAACLHLQDHPGSRKQGAGTSAPWDGDSLESSFSFKCFQISVQISPCSSLTLCGAETDTESRLPEESYARVSSVLGGGAEIQGPGEVTCGPVLRPNTTHEVRACLSAQGQILRQESIWEPGRETSGWSPR